MKLPTILAVILATNVGNAMIDAEAGFSMADDVAEFTMHYETIDNLIVLPVVINGSVSVNLILDTGCRNIVLFGKKLHRLFDIAPNKKIEFSGLGNGRPVTGDLSLNNEVSMGPVEGQFIPIVIVPQPNFFSGYKNIDGVIGYDIFIKFEVEINSTKQEITFRPAARANLSSDYQKVSIRIEDSRPIIQSTIFMSESSQQACSIMLDTGSTLGLLVKTTDVSDFSPNARKTILGRGLNGQIMGIKKDARKVALNGFEIHSAEAAITYSPWHNYASVGMGIMKDYVVVLNYCQSYAAFKRIS